MTASTDIVVRPAAELVPARPIVAHAAALGDPLLYASVTEFLATAEASRRAWERQISAAMPCTALDDDLWEDEDSWVSPMAGSKQAPVTMDWSALDWSQARGAA